MNPALIINLAPTGNIPQKADNARVPVSEDEIVADVTACAALGVSSVHLHARDSEGKPIHHKDAYGRIIGALRERVPELVLCVTCSGRTTPDFVARSEVLELGGDLRPDMASLTLGSTNFMHSPNINSPQMIRDLARKMRDHGIKPELEVFDVGMVNYAKFLIERGELEAPFYFNILLGNVASAQAELLHIATIVAALPPQSYWSLAGFGVQQLPMNAVAVAMGGGVRVGLEDNLWLDENRTKLASNTDLVERVVSLAKIHQRPIMRPEELRAHLELSAASS